MKLQFLPTRFFLAFLLVASSLLLTLSGCEPLDLVIPGLGQVVGGDGSISGAVHRERDVSGKLFLALGGVMSGYEDMQFEDSAGLVSLLNNDPDLFSLSLINGFSSYEEGQGAHVTPQRVGIGYVTPVTRFTHIAPIEITIPPQKLIQVLVGEARGELVREATLRNGRVASSSVSVTGEALGAVIRNRIDWINEHHSPETFSVDPTAYELDVPLSYYEAVIEAYRDTDDLYQFSPVNPQDSNHDSYLSARYRNEVSSLGADFLQAYDQAVLSAAAIFNGDASDPTGGSLGYYSPTTDQYRALKEASQSHTLLLPLDGGVSDGDFPALAPLQVILLKDVSPAFVFIRSRNPSEAAVVDE